MEPGRKTDFQTSVSRTVSRTSLGEGGLSFTLLDLGSLGLGYCGHGAASARGLGKTRVVQRVGRAPLDAHRATGARVVVDDEDRIRRGDLGFDRLVRYVLNDVRSHHEDAVPWAYVLTRAAQDAVVRIQHQVLGRPHALGEPFWVDRLHDVVGVDVDLGLLERHAGDLS